MSNREVVTVNRKGHPTPILIYRDEMVKGDIEEGKEPAKKESKKTK